MCCEANFHASLITRPRNRSSLSSGQCHWSHISKISLFDFISVFSIISHQSFFLNTYKWLYISRSLLRKRFDAARSGSANSCVSKDSALRRRSSRYASREFTQYSHKKNSPPWNPAPWNPQQSFPEFSS